MPTEEKSRVDVVELRRQAEIIVQRKESQSSKDLEPMSSEEIRQILHDLQVHQIELEMQNEELRRVQADLSIAKERFFDLYDLAPVGYITVTEQGLILEANLTAATLLGVVRGALIENPISQFILKEDQDVFYLYRAKLFQTSKPQSCQLRMMKKDGTIFWVHVESTVGLVEGRMMPVCRIVLSDISERKFQEDMVELTTRLIAQINIPDDLRQHMSSLTSTLQEWSGCKAVGIRLKDGDDFPYYETRGFPPAFVQAESHLCACESNGEILRDNTGSPVLECMCGNILRGRFDPAKPFFTANGSFWSNNTTALLASTTEADRQTRTRNRCNGEGYESVALIPLRIENQILGLLQFNDHRPNRFSQVLIAHLEEIANVLSIALLRHQTEERLRESEFFFKESQRAAHIGSYKADFVEGFWKSSEVLDQIFGIDSSYTRSIQGWLDIIHPDDREGMNEYLTKEVIEKHRKFDKKYRIVRQSDGEVRWVNGRGTLGLDADCNTVSMIGTIQDITEPKRAEEALGKSEQKYRLLAENIDDIIWTMNAELTHYTYISFSISKLGYTPEEFILKPFDAFIAPKYREHMQRAIAERLQKELEGNGDDEVRRWELEFLEKSGQPVYVESITRPLRDENGIFQGLLGVTRDITERKQSEEKIRRDEARLRRLVDILQHSFETIQELLDYGLDQAIQLTESKIGYIYHYHEDRKEFVLNSWSKEVLPACSVTNPQTCYELAKTGVWGEAVRQRQPIIDNDFQSAHPLKKGYPEGHVQLFKFMTIPIFKGENIVSVVGLANKETDYDQTDILQISLLMDSIWKVIENIQVEDEHKKLNIQLQQAQKMEAIGTLAGGIAHDFNNILGAILGYAEMIEEDSPAGSMIKKDIEEVIKASHRAKDLVKQILAFSRHSDTERIPIQPAVIIKEAVKMLRSSLPTTIAIQQDIDPEPGLIMADPTQLHQILMNLCTNAFHAMEETGGNITVSLQKKSLSPADIQGENLVQPGEFVQLSVEDTGVGIAPGIMEKIFDPYFTTKEVGKGTGMGLAIIHGIVKSYGGFVTCRSTLGIGTVFQVYLPVVAQAVLSETETLDLIQPGTEHILFIDDEEILAEMGKAMLERLGYRVTMKMNSIEALTAFQDQPNAFDLVITDQTMPEMTGLDMARRLLQIRSDLPIILCTGYSSQVSEEKARAYGFKGFAQKPVTRKDIAILIRKVLNEADKR